MLFRSRLDQLALPTTTLTSSANPSTFGQSVTFTATVTAGLGTPTGTVTFYDGTTSLGSVLLATGTARLHILLPAGAHDLTAGYEGSDTLLPSPQSNVVTVTTT